MTFALEHVNFDDHSNQVTAIPELLRMLDLKRCLVTVDAMGCRRHIAKAVLDAGAEYLLAVKGNQETLAEDVEQEFKQAQMQDFAHMDHLYFETLEKGHGRLEKRQYWYTHDIEGLGTLERWPGLAGMVMCRATRTVNGQTSVDDRYFITRSTHNAVEKIAHGVRAPLGHRKPSALSARRRPSRRPVAHTVAPRYGEHGHHTQDRAQYLKKNTTRKVSARAKRKLAGWLGR